MKADVLIHACTEIFSALGNKKNCCVSLNNIQQLLKQNIQRDFIIHTICQSFSINL